MSKTSRNHDHQEGKPHARSGGAESWEVSGLLMALLRRRASLDSLLMYQIHCFLVKPHDRIFCCSQLSVFVTEIGQ